MHVGDVSRASVLFNRMSSPHGDVDELWYTISRGSVMRRRLNPTCSVYQNTETQVRRLCQQYSLKIELYDVKVREIRGNEAKVEFCQKTVKLAGPEFHNNIITGVHTFRKVAGSWKLSSTKIIITRYLLLE
jgi:hypothetical protein